MDADSLPANNTSIISLLPLHQRFHRAPKSLCQGKDGYGSGFVNIPLPLLQQLELADRDAW